jgi:hypothetical protein
MEDGAQAVVGYPLRLIRVEAMAVERLTNKPWVESIGCKTV